MTPEFEKPNFIMKLSENMDAVAWSKPNDRYYAWQFALWAYRHAIDDVLEKLRSDPLIDGRRLEQEADLWADWLEREMLGEKK